MGAPKLTTPELRVVMTDDTEYRLRALNVDLVSWDRDRAKYSWPLPGDAPFVWLNYLAWHVMHREGLFPGNLREFESAAAEVSSATADDDAAEADAVGPTRPDHEPE